MGYDAGSYEGIDAQRKEYMYKRLIAARPDWANRVDLMYDAAQVELEYYRGINDGSIPGPQIVISVKNHGAKGDGITDDTLAIQAAFNSVPVEGGSVYLPPGKYLVTATITIPNRTKIVGAGGFDANFNATSLIVCATNAIDVLFINADGCTLEDFAVSYTGATRPTSGTGIRFAAGNHARVHRVGVNKFWNCLRFDTGYYYTVSDSGIFDPANYGIYLTNTAPGGEDHGDQGIINCVISKVADTTAGGTAVRWESGGGLRFIGNKINAGAQVGYNSTEKWDYGLDIMAVDSVSTGIFTINGNSIENCYQTMLRIGQAGPSNTGDLLGITITGNEIGVGWGSCDAVRLGAATPAAAGHIRTLNFSGNIIQNIPGRGIVADNITRLNIGANTFESVIGTQIALGSNHFYTTVDPGEQTISGSNVTIYSDATDSNNGGPFQRIQHIYQREINATTVAQKLWTFNIPAYSGGEFNFVLEGSIATLGAFFIKGSRYFTENTGVPAVTVIGADIASGFAGTDLDYTVDSATAGQIFITIARKAGSAGGVVIGRSFVTFNGPLSSIVKN